MTSNVVEVTQAACLARASRMLAFLPIRLLLYSYHLMRRIFLENPLQTLLLALLTTLIPSTVSAAQDLIIETEKNRTQVKSIQRDGQSYYLLAVLADATDCQLQTQEDTMVVTGPSGSLYLTNGRALVRFNSEYILLSSEPFKGPEGAWYVAEDFVARALKLVLREPLKPAGSGHYLLGSSTSDIHLELINRPDEVRLVIRPQKYQAISLMEYSDRIEVALGSQTANVRIPPVQPNPGIVASISQDEGLLIIRKGPRYDRFEESQPMTGPGFIIGLFGLPSTIVKLPPRSTPGVTSSTRIGANAERPENISSTPSDQLQDWRWGPLASRRCAVVIDPGHGGPDLGVSSGDLMEKNVTLDVALRIQELLERADRNCQLTRTRDVNPPIEQRSGIANYYQPKVFVSIHAGGSPAASTRSSAIYINTGLSQNSPKKSQRSLSTDSGKQMIQWNHAQQHYRIQSHRLATLLQQKLSPLSKNPTVLIEAPLAVLTPVGAPAVLLELGYLTNPSQRDELKSDSRRELVAEAVTESILAFLQDSSEAPGLEEE